MLAYHSKQKLWKTKVKLKQEDEILQSICTGVPELSWSSISKRFKEVSGVSRSAKQCRDRWTNCLRIEKYNYIFTDQEKKSIFKNFRKLGSKWSVLSAIIQSKSENQIKNLFYFLMTN